MFCTSGLLALLHARPSALDLRDRVNGGVRVPAANRLQTMPRAHPPPESPDGDLSPPPQRRRAERSPPRLRALPSHAADRRGRSPLRRAAGLRALPPAAPRGARPVRGRALAGARSRRAGAVRAPPDTGRGHYSSGRVDPVTANVTIDRPREEVFDVPRGHREPPGVHRPLPEGLAPDARRLRRPRRRRALQRRRAAGPLRLGRHDVHRGRAARTGSSRSGRGGKFNRIKTTDDWTLDAAAGGGTRVEYTTETEPALPTDRSWRRSAPARLVQAQAPQGAAPPAVDPRGGSRPRRARHRRRAVDSAARCRVWSSWLAARRRRSSPPAAGTRTRRSARRDRGHLRRRRRPQVPGPDLALPEPERRRGPRVPRRPAGRDRAAARRRDLVRRLHAGQERGATRRCRRPTRSRSPTRRATSYAPIPLDTNINPFAYQPGIDVPPATVLPLPNSAAGQGPIQGSLLLFKVKTDSLQNRPLELHFSNGSRARPASSTSTSRPASPARRASRTLRAAAGAAVSPPAPWPTSSTATATRGLPGGAKAANQASVSVVSSSGGVASARRPAGAARR